MPFDPNQPQNGDIVDADLLRDQFNSLKALLDAIPPATPETDPVFAGSEAALFQAGDKAKLDALTGLSFLVGRAGTANTMADTVAVFPGVSLSDMSSMPVSQFTAVVAGQIRGLTVFTTAGSATSGVVVSVQVNSSDAVAVTVSATGAGTWASGPVAVPFAAGDGLRLLVSKSGGFNVAFAYVIQFS